MYISIKRLSLPSDCFSTMRICRQSEREREREREREKEGNENFFISLFFLFFLCFISRECPSTREQSTCKNESNRKEWHSFCQSLRSRVSKICQVHSSLVAILSQSNMGQHDTCEFLIFVNQDLIPHFEFKY